MEGQGQRQHDALNSGLRPGDLAAALDWWRQAGVDSDFADMPQPWLAEPGDDKPAPGLTPSAPATALTEAPPAARIGGDPASWPADLGAFHGWWRTEPTLDGGPAESRVPPRGPAGAELMIVVGQPEQADTETLLSGSDGRLLAAMLTAMRIAPDAIYLASALPRHAPARDWAELGRHGLGAVLRHHVALARPRRLLVFGEGVLPLLSHDPAQNAQNSSVFYHEGQTIPLLGGRELGLFTRPAWKARFWRDWLDWTGTEAE